MASKQCFLRFPVPDLKEKGMIISIPPILSKSALPKWFLHLATFRSIVKLAIWLIPADSDKIFCDSLVTVTAENKGRVPQGKLPVKMSLF